MPKTYAKSSQQLAVPQYFYRPANSSCWYVRLVPSASLRSRTCATEFRRSTGQSDIKRARPIGLTLVAEKLREWEARANAVLPSAKSQRTILTTELVGQLSASRLYNWMCSDDDDRLVGLDDEQLAESEELCRFDDQRMREVLAKGPGSVHWLHVVENALEWAVDQGYEIERTDPLLPAYIRAFARVEREAQARIVQRNAGDDAETPVPGRPLVNLSAMGDEFRAYRQGAVEKKHLETMLNAWGLFVEFCGDIPLDSVGPQHIFEFMESRMRASSKPWSGDRAKNFGKRTLRDIFSLARARGMMEKPNPVDQLQVFPCLDKDEEASRKNPRFPFSTSQLNTLFTSAWYDHCEGRHHFRGKMATDLAARYWVPLIGLFHGNRVREGVQLVAGDFAMEGDLAVLSFRTELDEEQQGLKEKLPNVASEVASMRSLKNKSTRRTVPVHPALVRLGLMEFVEKRRTESGPNALLFPSSAPEPGGKSPKLGRAYEQAFLRFVRDKLNFGHGFGNHSFRHQLEDRIRSAQALSGVWPPGLGQQYSGRKRTRDQDRGLLLDEGSEKHYGKGYKAGMMLAHIEKLDFSDVALPVPFKQWLCR